MNTETPLKRIKTSRIVYVSPSDTMLKIEEVFDAMPIHHILVVENEVLHGVISKNDLLRIYKSAANEGKVPLRHQLKAVDIMTENPITLDTEDSIGLAADIFLSNQIHSIPVLNGDQLAGIITNHDLIKYCFR
ncbi:MAG: CBS domain-containing protein [Saprospiraceae bacterium]|nr:CBS domain-containing protein [Saprospiraceae bacterium]